MRKVSSISVLSLAAVSSLASAKCPVGQSYLTVKVVSGDLSRCTDSTTGPDTYVTVSVLDDGVKTISPMRTKIVGNNADPEWDQKLEFGCVTHDAPIVFNVKDHDYSAEEPCLGPIEIQGWPSSGEEQQVCATAPALLMGAPSDCLNYIIYYVRGTTSPDTTTDGEQAAIGISSDPMFPPAPFPAGDSEPVEVIPTPPPVEEPIGVDVPASDESVNDPFVNPSSARPSTNNHTEKPGQQEQIGETHRHPVDPIADPLPTDQENTSVVSQKKPAQHPPVQNVTTIPDPSMSQPALGKDGHLGHGSSKIDNGHSTGASSPSSSQRAKKGLKGDKLTGAISGSIVAVLVMAAAAFTAFFLTRRSRRYDLELHDDVPPTPQVGAHPHLEAAGVHANQQTAV